MTWWRRLLGRARLEKELDSELRDHIDRLTADRVRAGMSPDEARRFARLAFGGADPIKEACRDARGTRWLEDLARDARLSVRALAASRGFTTVALLVLTLSIGASTAIFSVVDAVVLRGLPFDRADRLVALGEVEGGRIGNVAPQNFLDWQVRQDAFSGLAAVAWGGLTLKGQEGQEPETLFGRQVTASFFTVLRTPPVIGRAFTIENEVDGNAHVAVISYGLWQRRFGGAIDVIGRHLPGQLGDVEIVGVMPAGFSYPVGARDASDAWMPLIIPESARIRGHDYGYYLQVIGRLRDDVSMAQAQARMDQIRASLKAEWPSWDRPIQVESLHAFITGDTRTWMFLLLGAVGCVLLIATVNLATLMLVRATTRGRELGIRSALGASRWDLARALLVESLVLALAGAALGVAVAWTGVDILRSAMPADVPRVADIAIDLRVLAAAVCTAIVTGLACGLAPVLQCARGTSAPPLHDRGRGNTAGVERQRLRTILVTAEVALAVILLVGSGLFLASYARVTNVDLGVDAHDVLTIRIRPLVGPRELNDAQQRNRGRLIDVLDRVRAIPGVDTASVLGGGLPFRGDLQTADISIPGRTVPPQYGDVDRNQISPDYFRALHVPLRQGRLFTDDDRDGSEKVVILNDVAARVYFPDENALGQTVDVDGLRRIVGIVGNIRHDGPETELRREAFVPLPQSRVLGGTLVVRTSQPLGVVLPPIKAAIWSQFPDLPLPDIRTLDQYLGALTAQRRVSMLLIGLFGLLGLAIAAVGIYGVMAYVVTQRTQEIGIRMALGAVPATILRSVLRRASGQLLVGLAIGLGGAWLMAGLVGGFLFHVGPHDALVYLAASGVLATVGLLAALLPARRAARIDPIVALRLE